MKFNFSKVFVILLLFFTSFSFIYGFSGNSTNYDLRFNIGHNIVFYNSTTNSTINSEMVIFLKPYSTNYFTRAGNIFFDFSASTYYNTPQFSILNLENNGNYNVSKLAINVIGEFFKDIENLNYSINGLYTNFTSSVSGRVLNGQIDLQNYGNNTINFYFTDIYGFENNYSLIINAILNLGNLINDSDGDGINNSLDSIFGNITNINTNIFNLTFEVNGTTNLSQIFNDTYTTIFKSNGTTIINFTNNYTSNLINMTTIIIKQERIENESKLLISGLTLETNNTKTMYLDLLGNLTKYSSLCIKDEDIFSFTQISNGCNQTNEYYILSIPYSNSNYTIDYINYTTNQTIKIQGLKHSGIAQVCSENWAYSYTCISGRKIRTAIDNNNCGTTASRLPLVDIGSCDSSSSSGGSSSNDHRIYTSYNPPTENNESISSGNSNSNNNGNNPVSPSNDNLETVSNSNSLNNDLENQNKNLDSNLNQENQKIKIYDLLIENANYFYIVLGVILLLIVLIFVKNKVLVKKAPPPNIQISPIERDYRVVKEYVQKYKKDYLSDQIYRQLIKSGYSHEVINKVFEEEY